MKQSFLKSLMLGYQEMLKTEIKLILPPDMKESPAWVIEHRAAMLNSIGSMLVRALHDSVMDEIKELQEVQGHYYHHPYHGSTP